MLKIVGFSEGFKEANKDQLISGSTKIIAIGAIIENGELLIEDLSQVQLQKIETDTKTGDCERSNVRTRCDNTTYLQSLKQGKNVFVLFSHALM